jgi:hypothetical protein
VDRGQLMRTAALLLLVACKTDPFGLGAFAGPEQAVVLDPELDASPYTLTVGFVANTRGGAITPLDLKHGGLLGDQAGTPFLGRMVATGDQRQLGPIEVWADEDSVQLYAVDHAWSQLLQVPFVEGLDGNGEPLRVPLSSTEPVFVDSDGSGDGPSLEVLELRHGFTTTEDWTVEFDGERWWVEGSRSGRQPSNLEPGKEYSTANKEVVLKLKGSATLGDRFEFRTDSGLVEHELGGLPLSVYRAPGSETLVVGLWDDIADLGQLVFWDALAGAEIARVDLPAGAQPWRIRPGSEGELFVADASLPMVHRVVVDSADPAASLVEHIDVDGLPMDVAWVHVPEDPHVGDPGYTHLFVALADHPRVDVYDLIGGAWLDGNPEDDHLGGPVLQSPVVGLSPTRQAIRLQEENNLGVREDDQVVAITTFDGQLQMLEGRSGCVAMDRYGPRIRVINNSESIGFVDRGSVSNPYLYEDPVTSRKVVFPDCGGVVRNEVWTLTYDGVSGDWRVEGSVTGEQIGRAHEDERYVSDQGEVSFLILAGTSPSSDGDTFKFAVEGGTLEIDTVLLPDSSTERAVELPGPPLVFQVESGPQGGGWDEDRTHIYALVVATNADFAFRADLQGWTVDAYWD